MLSIRTFKSNDIDIVSEFYERVFDGDVDRKMTAFKWIQAANLFGESERNYILIFVDGKLVGYWGIMPTLLYYCGHRIIGAFSQEALVDPTFRKQGIGTKLLEEVNRTANLMVSLWHNRAVLAIKKRGGWFNVGQYRPLKKIHRVRSILKLRNPYVPKILGQILKSRFGADEFQKRIAPGYDLVFVDKCGNEFDHFFMDVSPRLGIMSDRTSKTLNWKYIDIPHKKYIFISAKKEMKLCGYAVLRIEEQYNQIRKGIIVDLLTDINEPEALVYLIKKSDEIFSQNNVDFSVCIVQPGIFRNVLKKNGYYEAQSKKTDSLWIYNENNSPDKEVIKNMSNWYFTYGDSDGDMW